MTDGALASMLLAEAEKCRALESLEHTRLLCSPELQHYLATVGNEALSQFCERLAQEEREMQEVFDRLVIAKAGADLPAHSEAALRQLNGLVSQSLAWRYIELKRAIAEVEAETARYHSENLSLAKRIEGSGRAPPPQ